MIRGLIKINLARPQEAVSDLNEAVRLKPNSADPYMIRGMAKVALGKVEEAKVDYQMALKLAEQQGNEDLKANIEQMLQRFKDQE